MTAERFATRYIPRYQALIPIQCVGPSGAWNADVQLYVVMAMAVIAHQNMYIYSFPGNWQEWSARNEIRRAGLLHDMYICRVKLRHGQCNAVHPY